MDWILSWIWWHMFGLLFFRLNLLYDNKESILNAFMLEGLAGFKRFQQWLKNLENRTIHQSSIVFFIVWHVGLHRVCQSRFSVCLSASFAVLRAHLSKKNITQQTHEVRKPLQASHTTLQWVTKKPTQSLSKASHFRLGFYASLEVFTFEPCVSVQPVSEKLLTDLRCVKVLQWWIERGLLL